jgi:hypothetical protein
MESQQHVENPPFNFRSKDVLSSSIALNWIEAPESRFCKNTCPLRISEVCKQSRVSESFNSTSTAPLVEKIWLFAMLETEDVF